MQRFFAHKKTNRQYSRSGNRKRPFSRGTPVQCTLHLLLMHNASITCSVFLLYRAVTLYYTTFLWNLMLPVSFRHPAIWHWNTSAIECKHKVRQIYKLMWSCLGELNRTDFDNLLTRIYKLYIFKPFYKTPQSRNVRGAVSFPRWSKPSPVLSAPSHGGMARLSGSEWPG